MLKRLRARGSRSNAITALLRSALWPIPCLGVVLAIGLGVLLPALDGRWAESGEDPLAFVFGGGASAARDVLAVIAGSLISVTGLTFSLTVVALQLSSSQYSPRLLQTFVTDRVVQVTLSQLVLTFVYALTVLRTVRTEGATEDDRAFVPRLSVTVAYLLTLGSVLALVFFLGHLARALRVETLLRDVHDEASRAITNELGDGHSAGDQAASDAPQHIVGRPAVPVNARSSGFLVDVIERQAAAAARKAEVVIELIPRAGDPVVKGTPIAHAWSSDEPCGTVDVDAVEVVLDEAVRLNFERSSTSDVAYGIRKIVDIVVRALSPGINDPTTAVHALSHLSGLLGELASRPLVDRVIHDDHGAVRIVLPAWGLSALMNVALEEPLVFAAGQPTVLRRLATLLRELAWRVTGRGVDQIILGYIDRVADTAVRTAHISEPEAESWRQQVAQALLGQWPQSDRAASSGNDRRPVA